MRERIVSALSAVDAGTAGLGTTTAGDSGALRWPPKLAYSLYCALVRAAAFVAPRGGKGAWLPAGDAAECLRVIQRTWAPLRLTARAHALAKLQVSKGRVGVALRRDG